MKPGMEQAKKASEVTSFLMCDWEGCTTGTIGLPNPDQRRVVKTSGFFHPYYIQVYRSGSPDRFLAFEGEEMTWMRQPARQGIALFSVRMEFWRSTGLVPSRRGFLPSSSPQRQFSRFGARSHPGPGGRRAPDMPVFQSNTGQCRRRCQTDLSRGTSPGEANFGTSPQPVLYGPILDFQVLQSAKRTIARDQNGLGSQCVSRDHHIQISQRDPTELKGGPQISVASRCVGIPRQRIHSQ
jgi:hypothetical protein